MNLAPVGWQVSRRPLQAFNDYTAAHPNVKFDLSKPEDVANALNVAIPAGEDATNIIGWANDQIGQQAIKGNIVALNDYGITRDFIENLRTGYRQWRYV